jgi:hypothetical protein
MKTYKNFVGFTACVALFAASVSSGYGQLSQLIYLDENGTGYITPSQPFPYTIGVDPSSGMNTLEYTLPFAGVAGDVLLQELPGGPMSDILRFDGNSHVFFFSDNSDGVDSLADVGLPTTLLANTAGPFLETGVEGGFQNYIYTPTANQPGYKAAGPVAYNIVSDVPEPGTLLFGALGSGLLLLLKSRRQV